MEAAQIKLRPRSTWKREDGKPVHIAGLARTEPVDGMPVYWAIEGDWYTEDGRFWSPAMYVDQGPGRPGVAHPGFGPTHKHIAAEDTSDEAADWWADVAGAG